MNYRACVKLPLDINGIYYRIYTKILKIIIIIVHLEALENGRNTDIGTIKKEREDIFSESCTKIFKGNSYVMSTKYY